MITGTMLASMLSDRIALVLPRGFTVSAEDGVVHFESLAAPWRADSFVAELLKADDHASLVAAAWNVLSTAQDYVSQVTREQWPPPSRGGNENDQGVPYAAVDGQALRLGFKQGDSYLLELPPVPLAALCG
jgi:hypothetical protein